MRVAAQSQILKIFARVKHTPNEQTENLMVHTIHSLFYFSLGGINFIYNTL